MTQTHLRGKRIALLATDQFEDSELEQPLAAVRAAGAAVDILSLEPGTIVGKHGGTIEVTKPVAQAMSLEYDGLLLPGGVANPDTLRLNEEAVSFVRSFFDDDKPIGAICHAPWLLIEAGVVKGCTLTSWPSLKTDLVNAGAHWVDDPVVVDDGLVTSRRPDDLPAFCDKVIEAFAAPWPPV